MLTIKQADGVKALPIIATYLERQDAVDGTAGYAKNLPCYYLKEAACRLGDGLGKVLIAYDDDTPAGMIIVRMEDFGEGWAGGLFVEATAPRGTAWALLRFAAVWFSVKGAKLVQISTGPRNEYRRFYRKLGFSPMYVVQAAPISRIRATLRLSPLEEMEITKWAGSSKQ